MRKYLSSREAAGLWILCLSFLLGYCAGSQTAAAQESELTPIVLTPELALARICASEAGIQITDDCAAIHQVLRHGARERHMDYVQFAMLYATSVFDGGGSRPWLAELDATGTEPTRWPRVTTHRHGNRVVVSAAPSWIRYRRRWLELLQHARAIVHGRVRASCEPQHWGCPQDALRQCRDHDRAVRAGWQLVDCGDTRNEFWQIPEGS